MKKMFFYCLLAILVTAQPVNAKGTITNLLHHLEVTSFSFTFGILDLDLSNGETISVPGSISPRKIIRINLANNRIAVYDIENGQPADLRGKEYSLNSKLSKPLADELSKVATLIGACEFDCALGHATCLMFLW